MMKYEYKNIRLLLFIIYTIIAIVLFPRLICNQTIPFYIILFFDILFFSLSIIKLLEIFAIEKNGEKHTCLIVATEKGGWYHEIGKRIPVVQLEINGQIKRIDTVNAGFFWSSNYDIGQQVDILYSETTSENALIVGSKPAQVEVVKMVIVFSLLTAMLFFAPDLFMKL